MLFSSIYLDRPPLEWAQFPEALVVWLQNAGGAAAFGIALILLARSLSRNSKEWIIWTMSERLKPLVSLMRYAIIVSGIAYGTIFVLWAGSKANMPGLRNFLPRQSDEHYFTFGDWMLAFAGVLALFVVLTPVIVDLATRISGGRIWAMARLSWKEAIRGRIIWVFGVMAIIFLFGQWFVHSKPEDQIRNYVRLVYWSMTILFLLPACLLGSFSIPTDVNNNSIHTIVTKPVEKFEIVLGRFLGYAALLTVGLFVVSSLSLIYVVRGVTEEAARESYKARVPIYGKIRFEGTKSGMRGDNVGREWTYRSYITANTQRTADQMKQFAVWDFAHVPSDLANRTTTIPFEFAFDIFRLSKGKEGEGVYCTFTFSDGSRDSREIDIVRKQMKDEGDDLIKKVVPPKKTPQFAKKGKDLSDAQKAELEAVKKDQERYRNELAEIGNKMTLKYRLYHTSKEVTDYHTQEMQVPPVIFQAISQQKPEAGAPMMRVFVNVDRAPEAQMVGVAQQDFYMVAAERPFAVNFLKGVVGMWCTHMLVLGISLACSTYLSSVISFLATMFLLIAGSFVDYLREIAERRLDGGGPSESLMRITGRMPIAAKLEPSPTTTVIEGVDTIFSWWIGRILNLLPDVNRHDLHQYVANGFDISVIDVLLLDNALPLFGYLAPWAVLAYYLMKYREIANPQ